MVKKNKREIAVIVENLLKEKDEEIQMNLEIE